MLKPLEALNAGKPYAEQIKPFNFILSCHVAQARASDRRRSRAIPSHRAVRSRSAAMGKDVVDRSVLQAAKRYRITASGPHGSRTVARVKSYGDVLREYEFHPEAKCADSSGAPCKKQTIGLLGRRHVAIDSITYIGKESNKLEEVEEQSLFDPSDVYTEYPDPRRDEWATKILPRLKAMPMAELEKQTGLSRSTLQAIRAGRRPHRHNRNTLIELVHRNGSRSAGTSQTESRRPRRVSHIQP